jgi:alanine dehydrogenase
MKIGCPKEIKAQEFRVGLTPAAAREAVAHGHEVMIETGAGAGAGFTDDDYLGVGAHIVDTAEEVFAKAGMIVKVKEPQAVERKRLRDVDCFDLLGAMRHKCGSISELLAER